MPHYVLPDLTYDYGALEPAISGEIMQLHHDAHHAAYVKGANSTVDQLAEARAERNLAHLPGLGGRWRFTSPAMPCTRSFGRISPEAAERPEGNWPPPSTSSSADSRRSAPR